MIKIQKGLNAIDHGMLLNLLDHLERAPSRSEELLELAESNAFRREKNYHHLLKLLCEAQDEGRLVEECKWMRKAML